MCGITGFPGKFSITCLERAGESTAHRGPDGEGVRLDVDAGIGLAHRRLSILDPSPTGAQPMVGDDGSVALVFNGEIYNFRELRAALDANGHRFRGRSDTEVLLALYVRDGPAMLPRFNATN